jgi:hypothetical protein
MLCAQSQHQEKRKLKHIKVTYSLSIFYPKIGIATCLALWQIRVSNDIRPFTQMFLFFFVLKMDFSQVGACGSCL